MPTFRTRRVTRVLSERRGLQRVELDDGAMAYVLTQLIGPVAPGDPVVVNTTTVDLGLGTGGWHVVHWNLARTEWSEPGSGHIVKLRYTSLQVDAGAAEEEHGARLAELADLGRRPVVYCGLHSQVACVVAVLRHLQPDARIAYVMTDAAALPLALSDLVDDLCREGLLDVTVTAGQAFGGDLEAVNVPSALAVAAEVGGADAIVVGPGPGVVGTGTALGASSVELAAVLDAARALGGTPVATLRYSEAEQRDRHRGISRQTLIALGLLARAVVVPVPAGPYEAAVTDALAGPAGLAPGTPHEVVVVDVPDVGALLRKLGLDVTTMGRTADDDPGFFAVAGAAGAAAARALAAARPDGRLR